MSQIQSFKIDNKYFLKQYIGYRAIVEAYNDNTSVSIIVVADPYSRHFRGNGKTSYALRVAAAWYYFGESPPDTEGKRYSLREAWWKALDSIVFSVEEIEEKMDNSCREEIIICDDVGRWLGRKYAYDSVERRIFEALDTFRLNAVAVIWTALTPWSLPTRIFEASEWLFYISRWNKRLSKAETWRLKVNKSMPWLEPEFVMLRDAEGKPVIERFATYYPDEIHEEYNRRRLERFKHSSGGNGTNK